LDAGLHVAWDDYNQVHPSWPTVDYNVYIYTGISQAGAVYLDGTFYNDIDTLVAKWNALGMTGNDVHSSIQYGLPGERWLPADVTPAGSRPGVITPSGFIIA
jgi:hypothetical protein